MQESERGSLEYRALSTFEDSDACMTYPTWGGQLTRFVDARWAKVITNWISGGVGGGSGSKERRTLGLFRKSPKQTIVFLQRT